MAKELKINDGKTKVTITNNNGTKLGTLEFNPSDLNLPSRLEIGWNKIRIALDDLKHGFESLSDDDITGYGKLLSDADVKIKDMLDYIFDGNISEVFGNTNFATFTNDGSTLIENVMEALLPYIEEEIEKAGKKSKARMDKYTKDYEK